MTAFEFQRLANSWKINSDQSFAIHKKKIWLQRVKVGPVFCYSSTGPKVSNIILSKDARFSTVFVLSFAETGLTPRPRGPSLLNLPTNRDLEPQKREV
jgi:hypothetical protein